MQSNSPQHSSAKTSIKPNFLVGLTESFLLSVFQSSANLTIDALDRTQQVLDQVESLARRLNTYKHNLDEFTVSARKHAKIELLSLCHDSVDIGTESVRGLGKVLHAALDEMQDLREQSQSVFKDTFEPHLVNPFRKVQKAPQKEPTIIPISIQDN